MMIDEILKIMRETQQKDLTLLQEQILRQAWEGYTYAQIADSSHYQETYIKNIASQLWQQLSDIFSDSINKTNFFSKLNAMTPLEQPEELNYSELVNSPLEFPSGPVPLDSPFYIERQPLENICYAELTRPGSLIRLKAPKGMGKSSLLIRILDRATKLNYRTVILDFKEADHQVFQTLENFIDWFCDKLSRALKIDGTLEEHGENELGINTLCTDYLERVILAPSDTPLVLALHELHRVFEYAAIAQDFLSLLRSWHERAKYKVQWKKLRIIVVHTTEVYAPLNLNQSPFNLGIPISLSEFTFEQVQDLALRHGLQWKDNEGRKKIKAIMDMVGGHPYLIRLAIYYLVSYPQQDLSKILEQAPTVSGIYQHHLQGLFAILKNKFELAVAFQQIIDQGDPIHIEAITLHQLVNLGLVRVDGDSATCRCKLYRLYFKKQLDNLDISSLEKLREENQKLKELCNVDQLTQISNYRCFEESLEKEWRRLSRQILPLSLLLCDVDFFKVYNDTYGHLPGNFCLQRVAKTLQSSVHRPCDIIARYGGEEFAILLPETDATGALFVAEKIRRSIKNLGIRQGKFEAEDNNNKYPIITVSIGVACTVPSPKTDKNRLIDAADKALFQAKKQGRDQVVLSTELDFKF